jgi:hypothetical protein
MYVPNWVNVDTYRYMQIHTIHTDTYICIWGGGMHTICIVHMLYVCLDEIHTYTYNTYMHFQIHTRYAHAGSLMPTVAGPEWLRLLTSWGPRAVRLGWRQVRWPGQDPLLGQSELLAAGD